MYLADCIWCNKLHIIYIQYLSLLRLRTFRDGRSATLVQLGVQTYESS